MPPQRASSPPASFASSPTCFNIQRSSSPVSQCGNPAEVARLKRRLAAAQEEIGVISGAKPKKVPTMVTMGRGICRLISLYESIEGLIDESDRRFTSGAEGVDNMADNLPEEAAEMQRSSDRTYASFVALLRLIPRLKSAIEDESTVDAMDHYVTQLQKGANDARSDDVRRIKEELACWLNQDYTPTPSLAVKSRSDRGLQNDLTGRLLTSIEYDWDDEQVRADIRGAEINVSEDYFLSCLYPKGKGDPEDIEKHFLRSALLVKTYSAIFTSPSSSESFEEESEEGPARKKLKTVSQRKATKSNVATLLRMEGKVTARSIAYAAVLLVFNLTDAAQWSEVYNGFSFRGFYNFIIDFFEDTDGPSAKKKADNLLKWWNNQIFTHHDAVSSATHKSRNKLAAQRALREQNCD